jgi:hypothetical protein
MNNTTWGIQLPLGYLGDVKLKGTRWEVWLACKASIQLTSRRVLSSRPATGHSMPIPGHASAEDMLGKLQPFRADHAESQAHTDTHGLY